MGVEIFGYEHLTFLGVFDICAVASLIVIKVKTNSEKARKLLYSL